MSIITFVMDAEPSSIIEGYDDIIPVTLPNCSLPSEPTVLRCFTRTRHPPDRLTYVVLYLEGEEICSNCSR